ncbi:MAG: radical SAM protein [Fibromonadales bacterium]|nr:radical SAM protein [Fibromonadales bacterium]
MFLPISRKEMDSLGWDCADVIIVSGDAYVDHPAFGHAVIARILESEGLRVAILPQPNWRDDLRDFKKLGQPKLFFGVTSGCLDSVVSHYTANKRLRSDDAYTPGGQAGFRPDRATTVYSKILKQLFPNTPVILGGIEASLRKTTHYDFMEGRLMPSILCDSNADLLVYGMGEKPIIEIARKMQRGENIFDTPQVAFLRDMNPVINPPFDAMTEAEIDRSFDLPYERKPHPRYLKRGDIPAFEMIKNSITTHRGCFGGCSFCAIHEHQGKFIASRSEKSILEEAKKISGNVISDLGGPSANMYKMGGVDKSLCSKCKRRSCLFPEICDNLNTNHKVMNELYAKVSRIKKVFIGSGVRYDMLLHKPCKENDIYIENLILHHTSGRLKLAPEHTEEHVLKLMGKPSFEFFKKFLLIFQKICGKHNLKTQIMPYLMSSHPGCTMDDMKALARKLKDLNIRPEQVQDFTPTPSTPSTDMFYRALTKSKDAPFVATGEKEKLEQKGVFFL